MVIFMIAKIMLNDKEYWSYIFFICKCDYQTKAIAYNLNEEKFEFLSAFKNKYTSERIIYLFDYKEENLVKKDFIKKHGFHFGLIFICLAQFIFLISLAGIKSLWYDDIYQLFFHFLIS